MPVSTRLERKLEQEERERLKTIFNAASIQTNESAASVQFLELPQNILEILLEVFFKMHEEILLGIVCESLFEIF